MTEDIFSFYRQFYPALYKDKRVRELVLAYNSSPVKIYHSRDPYQLFILIFDHYLEEANRIIDLISSFGLDKKKTYLEIGGGLGLVYGYLKHCGYQIYSCEPSLSGYDNFFQTGQSLLKNVGISASGWKPFEALEVKRFNRQFDLIFSCNVVEHIQDLREIFFALKQVLKPGGIMLHNTVNYLIPYEPHFKILLLPFFPRLTEIVRPNLKKSPIWKDLNFITPFQIYSIARQSRLAVKFIPNQLSATIKRFDSDPEFRRRHFRLRKYLVALKILSKLPTLLQTPLAFTLKHPD
jgi:2-polyprenyl-3-methyl-5-hydroxy-6-metoxy-1,4-benzoquinol methylase